MTFWREGPPPPWQERFERAKDLVLRHSTDPTTSLRLDDVERPLLDSLDDQAKLEAAIQSLRPEDAAAELKRALRAGPSPTSPDAELLRAAHAEIEHL